MMDKEKKLEVQVPVIETVLRSPSTSSLWQLSPKWQKNLSDMKKIDSRLSAPLKEILYSSKAAVVSRDSVSWTNCNAKDEEFRSVVYKQALEMLLDPSSKSSPHTFEWTTFKKPTYCVDCDSLIWGLANQGLKCTICLITCHQKCLSLINSDCLIRVTEKRFKDKPEKEDILERQMSERIEDRVSGEAREALHLLRRAFDMSPVVHRKHIEVVKQNLIAKQSNWFAKLEITVVSAKNLMALDRHTDSSDPYVTVEVGKVMKKTQTIERDLCPTWNRSFTFDCHKATERVKLRVWDEDRDIKSRVVGRFTEKDDFLGQKILDIGRLSGDMDVTYDLEKRFPEDDDVSGSIRVNIKIDVRGNMSRWNYYEQYLLLHEIIFNYLCEQNDGWFLLPQSPEAYFEFPADDVVKGFASRSGIEKVFVSMTHFSCLANVHRSERVPGALFNLLGEINLFYTKDTVTNFGTDRFEKLLGRLYNLLRQDLSIYRCLFPVNNPIKLIDLNSTIVLMNSILTVREKIKKTSNRPHLSTVITEAIQACLRETYRMFRDNCQTTYEELSQQMQYSSNGSEQKYEKISGPLDYWHQFMVLIRFAVEEDRATYQEVLKKYLKDVNVGELSARMFWEWFKSDLKACLADYALRQHVRSRDAFISFHLAVNSLHKWLKDGQDTDEEEFYEYYEWFKPLVLLALSEVEKATFEVIRRAYGRDRNFLFLNKSGGATYSDGIQDLITFIIEIHENFIVRLKCPIETVEDEYRKKLAKSLMVAVNSFSDIMDIDLKELCEDAEKRESAQTLLCNMKEIIDQLSKLFVELQDPLLGDANGKHTAFFSSLSERLKNWTMLYSESFIKEITKGMTEMNAHLRTINGPIIRNKIKYKEEIEQEASFVADSLMELIQSHFELYDKCRDSIRRALLINFWNNLLIELKEVCLFPNFNDARRVETPQPSEGNFQGPIGLSRLWKSWNENSNVKIESVSARQCEVLREIIYVIKDCFCNNGLDEAELETSHELKSVLFALPLFADSTDALVKSFIKSQRSEDAPKQTFGSIILDLDKGEHKFKPTLLVKVIACEKLHFERPKSYVEVVLNGPNLEQRRSRTMFTRKGESSSPRFNDSQTFILSDSDDLSAFELQLMVKDHSFTSKDAIIGLSALNLSVLSDDQSMRCTLNLVGMFEFDEIGETILRVLAQRPYDELAKDFLDLKSVARIQ